MDAIQNTAMEPKNAVQYKAVLNHEEQYSIWLASKPNPAGWTDAGCSGTKEECLEFIRTVWTDMRPLSLRRVQD